MCLFSKFSNLDDISSHRVTLLYDLFNVYKNYILETYDTFSFVIHIHEIRMRNKFHCRFTCPFSLLAPNVKTMEANNPDSFHYWNRLARICSLALRDDYPLPACLWSTRKRAVSGEKLVETFRGVSSVCSGITRSLAVVIRGGGTKMVAR